MNSVFLEKVGESQRCRCLAATVAPPPIIHAAQDSRKSSHMCELHTYLHRQPSDMSHNRNDEG